MRIERANIEVTRRNGRCETCEGEGCSDCNGRGCLVEECNECREPIGADLYRNERDYTAGLHVSSKRSDGKEQFYVLCDEDNCLARALHHEIEWHAEVVSISVPKGVARAGTCLGDVVRMCNDVVTERALKRTREELLAHLNADSGARLLTMRRQAALRAKVVS